MKYNSVINKINYFIILSILLFTYYNSNIYTNIYTTNLTFNEKILNILLLIFFTITLFLYNGKIKKIKIIFIITLCTLFLRMFYLSFYIIIISIYVEKNIRLKQLLVISIFFYLLTVFLWKYGYLDFNNIKSGIRYFKNFSVYRLSLGFFHPNTAMYMLLPIFSIIYYLYYDKFKFLVIALILGVGSLVFKYTFSRTTFILIILFIILILIKDEYIKKLKNFFILEGFLLSFFTFYSCFYLKESILNKFFSGRLWLFHYYLSNYEINFLGNKGMNYWYKIYPLDNMYLRVLFENGILGFLLLLFLIFYIMKLLFKNKDYKAVRIFSIILIFCFMEARGLFYYFNVIYFIISDYIFKIKSASKEYE